ncbi:hypothetical protein Caci_1397 [Catenulispora acidiphila DSM 44928]|uniref:Uncharacterized protein n=1 Tax=Catenulispora acidiphila (strain DSM 44928 / JCM 14897 / NBRC 102108 / NRRL B-24433 / ID139908) TaxID=479433 RepID=C7Q8Q5_CATAD|nr:hypothetical protein [Catenulispora acidiphila]ACU70320.1 hypothetical protein Caci_1397 [Catenulispora acidiphila DSM 44928]
MPGEGGSDSGPTVPSASSGADASSVPHAPSPSSSQPSQSSASSRRGKERIDRLPPDLLEPVVEPRCGIDGWTYQGTELEECFPPQVEAELAQTVHMICTRLATAWNYRRAAQLLESQRAYSQAYAVLEIWSAEGPDPDPTLPKWRARLARAVLANTGA